MPLILNTPSISGGTAYGYVVVGDAPKTHHIKVDLSTLTTDFVDANGWLKPGTILRLSGGVGVPISAGSQSADGVVIEATRLNLTTVPPTNTTLASETADHLVAVGTHFHINQDMAAGNIGRALSANELASLAAAMITYSST